MKYLVLGSSGQVGTHLTKTILESGDEVIEFDIIRAIEEDLRVYSNDLLSKAMDECDFVFFLAFDIGGSRYMAKYQKTFDFINNNIEIMHNVFAELKRTGKPFIFASSQMSNMLYSSYGVLKAIGEYYTQALNGIVVKFWNVYGYETDPEKTHVITDFVHKANGNKLIDMLTDGQEERQFLYGDDCAECLILLSQNHEKIDREKNLHITSFEWVKIVDIAKIISKEFPGTEFVPAPSKDLVQLDARNEPDRYILEFWQPKHSIEEGIRKTIKILLN